MDFEDFRQSNYIYIYIIGRLFSGRDHGYLGDPLTNYEAQGCCPAHGSAHQYAKTPCILCLPFCVILVLPLDLARLILKWVDR